MKAIFIIIIFFSIELNVFKVIAQSSTDLNNLKKGVAKITVFQNNEELGTGAGIVIGKNENYIFILTANHVLRGSDKVQVKFYIRAWETFIGKRYEKYNENLDIGIVIVRLTSNELIESFPKISIGDLSDAEELDEVINIGHPLGSDWQPARNDLLKLNYEDDIQKLSITKKGLQKGNSGGPLFNDQLEIIGIITDIDPIRAIATKLDPVLKILENWGIPYDLLKYDGNGPSPPLHRIHEIVADHFNISTKDIGVKTRLVNPPLNMDGLDLVEIILAIEAEYNIDVDEDRILDNYYNVITIEMLSNIIDEEIQ